MQIHRHSPPHSFEIRREARRGPFSAFLTAFRTAERPLFHPFSKERRREKLDRHPAGQRVQPGAAHRLFCHGSVLCSGKRFCWRPTGRLSSLTSGWWLTPAGKKGVPSARQAEAVCLAYIVLIMTFITIITVFPYPGRPAIFFSLFCLLMKQNLNIKRRIIFIGCIFMLCFLVVLFVAIRVVLSVKKALNGAVTNKNANIEP